MRNYLLVLLSIFTLNSAATLNAQDDKVVTVIFNGFDGELYTFSTITKSKEDAKTIKFKEVSTEILKQFDLKSETSKGMYFLITYTVITDTEVNSDGEKEDIEVFTLKTIRQAVY